jgi:hypothetical protein
MAPEKIMTREKIPPRQKMNIVTNAVIAPPTFPRNSNTPVFFKKHAEAVQS